MSMILLSAALALASFETVAAPPQQPAPGAEAERKICRVEGAPTGSRMSQGKRVCRTASEWAAERRRVDSDADRVKRSVEP
ncbi:hypothetical protein BFL28_18655 [Sphingomonas turrisvirgatae]|uniref:Uncharacterized protein n=2 Tax=Sphingomonas turrisvirgatae TaxID=1888892 RepID=A0A1E3LWE6_9SPHN|nr:hypothetical protein BFL28_18655 [Sphingomonas turrisvirgatae]